MLKIIGLLVLSLVVSECVIADDYWLVELSDGQILSGRYKEPPCEVLYLKTGNGKIAQVPLKQISEISAVENAGKRYFKFVNNGTDDYSTGLAFSTRGANGDSQCPKFGFSKLVLADGVLSVSDTLPGGNAIVLDTDNLASLHRISKKDLGKLNNKAFLSKILGRNESVAASKNDTGKIGSGPSIGDMVCNSGPGSAQIYSGYVIAGKPYFNTVPGTINFVGFIEGVQGNRVQIRISAIKFSNAKTGGIMNLEQSDYNNLTLRINSVLWDERATWSPC